MPTPNLPALRESNPPRRPVGIVAALSADHAKVRNLIAQVVNSAQLAPALYPQIAELLRRHDAAEDTTLYTLLSRKHPLLVEQSRGQHARVASALRRLDNTQMGHPIWQSRFGEMNRALETHLRFEEGRTFDAARALPERVQQRLATEYKALMRERQSNPPIFRRMTTRPPKPDIVLLDVTSCPAGYKPCGSTANTPGTSEGCCPKTTWARQGIGLTAAARASGISARQIARQAQAPSWLERLVGVRAKNLVLNPSVQKMLYPDMAKAAAHADLGRGISGESSEQRFLGTPYRGVRRLAPRPAPTPNPELTQRSCGDYTGDGGVDCHCCFVSGGNPANDRFICVCIVSADDGSAQERTLTFKTVEQARQSLGLRRKIDRLGKGASRRLALRPVPAPNPPMQASLVADAAEAHRLAQNHPQYVATKPIPTGLGGWHGKSWIALLNGAQALPAGRIGAPGSCPTGFVVLETIYAAPVTPIAPGAPQNLMNYRICRPMSIGMVTPSQGPAAGEIHTDAFGHQYTTGSGERSL